MLRVGLTGGLGSGKSTVAGFLRDLGAYVVEADQLGRELMRPGHAVYEKIVQQFGNEVVCPDGELNRARLAELAFTGGRLNELNAIVHPAVISAQQHWMDEVFARDTGAIAVVESALIFEVERDARERGESEGVLADWRRRFDCIVLLTAPDETKIERFVNRVGSDPAKRDAAVADARLRLSRQMRDAEKAARADFVIENTLDREHLRREVGAIWKQLRALEEQCRAQHRQTPGSLK
ncbi:dephospho-CoA kinase [Acidobacteria bacterium AB60]|nr:dephospho-CoA kinase [Acidobacteria bacterium AB60]